MAERTTTLDVLRRARELLSEPQGWTQGTFARDIRGRRAASARDAVCWCAIGALLRATDVSIRADAVAAVAALVHHGIGITAPDSSRALVAWNDCPERTHAEVLEAFDRAIAAEEQRHG